MTKAMKGLMALVMMAGLAVASVAVAGQVNKPTVDDQVQAAIDARLHELMVQMQAKRLK